MVIASTPAASLAEAVKEEIKSPTTTTALTLKLLRALLGTEVPISPGPSPSSNIQHDAVASARTADKDSAKAAPKRAKPAKSRGPARVVVFTAPETCLPLPTDAQKLSLATDTFNKTLKTLSNEAKSKDSPQAITKRSPGAASTPLRRNRPGDGRPLQETSPNRRDKPLSPEKLEREPPVSVAISESNLIATAKCAQTALDCLRHLEKTGKEAQCLQIDRGSLILLCNLNQLGLVDLAVQEIHALKQRLDHKIRVGAQLSTPAQVTSCRQHGHLSDAVVGTLLFDEVPHSTELCDLVISFQKQVLKTISSHGPKAIGQSLVEMLEVCRKYGPYAIIYQGYKSHLLSADKAALHLSALAQAVSSLCSFARPVTAEAACRALPPELAFKLQVTTLEIQCSSWTINNSQINADQNMWAPFLRFMRRFCHSSTAKPIEQYNLVRDELQRLSSALETRHGGATVRDGREIPASVTQYLAKLAQDGGCYTDSIDLLRRSIQASNDPRGLSSIVCRCNIATMCLLAFLDNPGATLCAAEEALTSLKGSMKFSAHELEDMLLHGVQLRKAALDTLWKLQKSTELAPLLEIHLKLRSCSIRIIFAFLNFLLRFIGNPSADLGASSAGMERFHQKVRLARSIAETTISNTLSAARSAVDNSACSWAEVDSALQECCALANVLDTAGEQSIGPDTPRTPSSTAIKVSNIYWSQFLRCKEGTSELNELLRLLKSSVHVLENRPGSEQQIGFLAAKYERIASIYMDSQKFGEASNALERAITGHLSSRPFEEVINAGPSQSMRSHWDNETSAIFALGKTLTTYVKLSLSLHKSKQQGRDFYDDEVLGIDERIALLERQFGICTALSADMSKFASIAALARSTLALYSSAHILRHVQFLLAILKYSLMHQNDYIEHLLEEQLIESKLSDLENDVRTQSPKNSCGLALFTSLCLQWSFKKSRPSTQLLRDAATRWSALISNSEDWRTLETHLEDPGLLACQIQSIIDYADMQGLTKLRLNALSLQIKMLESQKRQDMVSFVLCLIQTGVQCSRLGAISDAGRALASARDCIDSLNSLNSRPHVSLQYYLAYAEYLQNIFDFEGSLQALEAARSLYAEAFPLGFEERKQRLGLSQTKFLCQSAYWMSRWEFDRGDLGNAVLHAKQCVKLTSQIWAGTQKLLGHDQLRPTHDTNDSTLDSLVDGISNMNISNNVSNERPGSRGTAFWPYVSIHCEALVHMSSLLAISGLYQDAIYYADQAQSIAQAVESPVYTSIAGTLLLAHRCKGNQLSAGLETSSTRRIPLEAEHAHMGIVSSFVYLAEASISAGDFGAASGAIEEATQVLSRIDAGLTPIQATAEDEEPPVVPILMSPKLKSRVKLADKNTRKAAKATSARPRGKERPAPAVKSIAQAEQMLCVTPARFETTINVLKAHILLSSGKGQDAMSLLARSKDVPLTGPDVVRRRLIEARTALDEIFRNLSADAVHCVLAETAMAFPSLHVKERTSGKEVILDSPVATKPPSRSRRLGATNSRRPIHQDTESDRIQALATRTVELFLEAIKGDFGSCSTNILRELSLVLGQCLMYSSVLLPQRNYTPIQVALQAAIPSCSAMARERSVIVTDVVLANKSNISLWPERALGDKATSQLTCGGSSLIQPDWLDRLPEQWEIVSIQLSRTQDELSISKLHIGQPPFSLRIPLRRSSSDGADEVDISFAAAKLELLDIIKMANKTAHDSRGQSDKQAKRSWWAEREALDDRLKTLLENIENIWLGGFRGILAHQHRHEDLLSRFSGSLLRSLNQHLPSRQKTRKMSGAGSHLHAHVLDLFVALGHPDERDLDDSIADLLYFVVDILQFHGEYNAYDEIDFDMITVEVLDALRCYHEALRAFDVEHPQHLILILDKELLAFPWESLPCLEGRPVSRMPSLNCVESRLDKMRLQDQATPALSISARNGAYILNPSSDLKSTQATFAATFSSSLPSFSSIIDRVPTETEFESHLREKDLFLYFGHGSGAQYIRGRNIKRLERCAVTFLMGCSSGKMVECGEFEPYGVPWNYMHAGAPAMVGTLWDVTDKDIDRFAMKTFTEWGLVGDEVVPEQSAGGKKRGTNAKGKAKGGKPPSQSGVSPKEKVTLDEAVANARSSCVLRYLNGAAPVVYGIPVALG